MADVKEIQTSADLLKELNDIKTGLEAQMEQKADARFDEKIKIVNDSIEEIKNIKPEVTAEELKAMKDEFLALQRQVDLVDIRVKHGKQAQPKEENRTFNQILGETIDRYANELKNFRGGELKMDMMPEVKEKNREGFREVKTVGDMSISANFSSASEFITDRRTNLIETPYNRVWLADILPQGTTNSPSILYPKENGGEGGAAPWVDPTADKVQMDYDFTTQQAYVKWIAGYVIIAREMLDDIPWLRSYIQNKMLISLKTAENDFVLNGEATSPAVEGLLDVATAYSGSYTLLFEKILDAAFGQIPEDTFSFYNGNVAVIRPRDAVNIGLNTASGSGEYDLPPGSVGWVNGNLQLGGLRVVQTTQIGAAGSFLVFDTSATTFIRRMQPELRLFEDATLAKKNKLMFRVEERVTLATFNDNAIVASVVAES